MPSNFFPLIFLCRRGLLLQVVLEASQVCNIYWLPHYSYTNPFNVKNANYIVPGVQQPIFSHTTYSKQCFTVFCRYKFVFFEKNFSVSTWMSIIVTHYFVQILRLALTQRIIGFKIISTKLYNCSYYDSTLKEIN